MLMNVVFFSNYLNHHQLPFCLAMDRLTGGQFTFVATAPVKQSRLDLGYADMNHAYPFVLCAYESAENEAKAMALALDAEVIITGSAPEKYTAERAKRGGLTFRYSERLYKDGRPFKRWLHDFASAWLHHGRLQKYPVYMLCASAYTAGDCARFGNYRGKTYKWGYFPELRQEKPDELSARHQGSGKIRMVWAGRLLDWKHPEMAVRLAETLRDRGYAFSLEIIGSGALYEPLEQMIAEARLSDCVQLLRAMPPENVRAHMEEADIFLFTSDFHEGWGAVLNEAMNSGCAVVASHAIGSVGFLVENGVNGLIFRSGDQDHLNAQVIRLMEDAALRRQMGRAAYATLEKTWNAEVAAERLLQLTEHLLRGGTGSPFAEGPCSPAEAMTNQTAEKRLLSDHTR